MAEYIKREDALNEIHRFRGYIDDDMEYRMKTAINKIPSADVRPVVRGKWVTRPYMMGQTEYCSRCGENYGRKHNFCPNCGTDMREAKADGTAQV